MDWKKTFEALPDFRREHVFKKHLLSDILTLSLCATICGAENDEEIETYGKEKECFLRGFLELPNGIPSHDTITRVFRHLDNEKFASCLYRYSDELKVFLEENHISIDGKVCRATNKKGKKKDGICIITAWACEQQLCLGQLKVEKKSSEKTAWKNIKSVVMVHSVRDIGNKIQEEYRFYLSSKEESANYFNRKIREHWSIENQLHWHRTGVPVGCEF